MYLVTVISNSILKHAMTFIDFGRAADYADDLIVDMAHGKAANKLPHWQSKEYYTHEDGTTVTLISVELN